MTPKVFVRSVENKSSVTLNWFFFLFSFLKIERKPAGPYSAPHTDAEMEATWNMSEGESPEWTLSSIHPSPFFSIQFYIVQMHCNLERIKEIQWAAAAAALYNLRSVITRERSPPSPFSFDSFCSWWDPTWWNTTKMKRKPAARFVLLLALASRFELFELYKILLVLQ